MKLVGDLATVDLTNRLQRGILALKIGPYIYNVQSNVPSVTTGIARLYADFRIANAEDFVDFDVGIEYTGLLQRLRGETKFLFDKKSPFEPIPRGQAYAFLEWGMNWCVSLHTNEYLKLHAAAISRNGSAIIMPGIPGAGKSTLCAALGLSGWRILSDEHALIVPNTTKIVPLCRPVSLKNESINAIRSFSSDAVFGPVSERTHKGVVAHMKADMHPHSHDIQPLQAGAMVFPRYSRDEPQRLNTRARTASFILAAYHSFNYSLLCETGFEAMKTLIANVECYDLVYHDLDWAVKVIDELPLNRADR
ncbi:MAG: HprK-related kinase A [Halioglobus sp.]